MFAKTYCSLAGMSSGTDRGNGFFLLMCGQTVLAGGHDSFQNRCLFILTIPDIGQLLDCVNKRQTTAVSLNPELVAA